MKQVVLLLTLLACAVQPAQAQGTVQFRAILTGSNEVPPNNSTYIASGRFDLSGNTLNYSVWMTGASFVFTPTGAGIYGPAPAGLNGNLILDLGNYILSFNPPQRGYIGGFDLTSQQISDLEAGLWYVNFNSSSFPNGEIRGQITAVPEPSTLTLLGLGAAGLALLGRKLYR